MDEILKVDSREPIRIFNLLNRLKIEYTKESLPIGDFIYKDIVFERKSLLDFISSIRTGHIQKQILQMQENFDKCYLLISGSYKQVEFNPFIHGWTVNHHLGALASVATRYDKLKVLQLDNDTQLVKVIPRICKKAYDGKVIGIQHTELLKNRFSIDDIKLKMIMCLPMVGYDKALAIRKILDIKFVNKEGNPISKEGLNSIDGVGKKTISNIMGIND